MYRLFVLIGWLAVLATTCVVLSPPAAMSGEQPKDPIAALFDAVPEDLRTAVASNSVRRDRLNDWLKEHLDGKGKTVELTLPVRVRALRSNDKNDKSYRIVYTIGAIRTGPAGKSKTSVGPGPDDEVTTKVFGDKWRVLLQATDAKAKEVWPYQFELLAKVSAAEAEKLVDAQKAVVKATVTAATVPSGTAIRLKLADIQVDGKKVALRKFEPAKKTPPPPKK